MFEKVLTNFIFFQSYSGAKAALFIAVHQIIPDTEGQQPQSLGRKGRSAANFRRSAMESCGLLSLRRGTFVLNWTGICSFMGIMVPTVRNLTSWIIES